MDKRIFDMKRQSGFTLIELMIVVAIVAILAAIALPAYQNYTKKARFTEVVSATGGLKTAIEVCFNDQGTLSLCSTPGSNGIPSNAGASGLVASVTTTGSGVITATASGAGITGKTYILTPTPTGVSGAEKLIWGVSGTCKDDPAIC